jgi:Glyoxalase superfamily protein/ClpX C4-type zinc finger
MSTHQDAKAMAKLLRAAMARKNVTLSHGECLEIVSQQMGYTDWNTLSAKLHPAVEHGQVFCSFCDKSKQEVRVLAEGGCRSRKKPSRSCVFICDECVAFCSGVFADRLAIS